MKSSIFCSGALMLAARHILTQIKDTTAHNHSVEIATPITTMSVVMLSVAVSLAVSLKTKVSAVALKVEVLTVLVKVEELTVVEWEVTTIWRFVSGGVAAPSVEGF